jgi:putative selenium metabolism hydrolase
MIDNARKDQLVDLCRNLIMRPSLSGQEKEVAEYVHDRMKALGFDSVHVDAMGNVIGKITLGRGGKRILLEGHMDHVPVSDPSKWHFDPFGAKIVDGKIYGRATSDMKGNLAAMILAASFLKQDHEDGLNGEIIVAGSVHEECFEGVASELIGRQCEPDMVIIGEASNLTLKRGQRGRAEVVLETKGKTAHSSNPSVGLNAVRKMMKVLLAVEGNFVPSVNAVLGEGILEVTDIISSPFPGASVVPDNCRVTFDRRLLVDETEDFVLGQIQQIIDEAASSDPDIRTELYLAVGEDMCYTGEPIRAVRFAPGWLFPDDHPFVQTALDGLREVGQNPELSHYYFCTNGSYYAGKAGIPTIGYGGSLETLAHVDDEYIEIDQLVKACEGYYGIVRTAFGQVGRI